MVNNIGCLLVHGFGGDYEEVRYLAEYLKTKGYNILCPSLKGHTGRRMDLMGVDYTDWIRSAEGDLISLKENSNRVFIVGFSMGGLIGINLCEKYDIDGLVTLNTPIYYWDIKNILRNIIEDFRTKDFQNIRRYMVSSGKFPMSALYNFRRLLSITKSKIKQVKCPAFIVQAKDDDTVRVTSAKYIFDRIASKDKNLKYYNNSGHVILTSPSAEEVSKDVEAFFESIRGNME
ncbi:alpha/beta fold hydrolase [Wukongibacter baidiensis]|uniref:alpha/beta hydrolase n=1 Tax=Wukongibacter baidiensis TaxID=1723361 RepID=UPI003D7F9ADC